MMTIIIITMMIIMMMILVNKTKKLIKIKNTSIRTSTKNNSNYLK